MASPKAGAGAAAAAWQRAQARDALLGRRMRAQERRLGQAVARHQDLLPHAALEALELGERRGEPGRIAGQPCRIEVRLVFPRPRQRQLQERGQLRREDQQRDHEPGKARGAAYPQRDREEQEEQPGHGHEAGQPADQIGQPHEPQVVVADVAELVRQHAGQLAQGQGAQHAVGERDHRIVALADRERVQHPARDVVELRPVREPGAPAPADRALVNTSGSSCGASSRAR